MFTTAKALIGLSVRRGVIVTGAKTSSTSFRGRKFSSLTIHIVHCCPFKLLRIFVFMATRQDHLPFPYV